VAVGKHTIDGGEDNDNHLWRWRRRQHPFGRFEERHFPDRWCKVIHHLSQAAGERIIRGGAGMTAFRATMGWNLFLEVNGWRYHRSGVPEAIPSDYEMSSNLVGSLNRWAATL